MVKIRLILRVLVFIGMTMTSVFAAEENRENPPQDMIERHDRDGDRRVSRDEFPGPDEHFTRIDLDGDGLINQDEARQNPLSKRQGGRVPGRFYEDDADGDGVVSRTEFSGPPDHFDRLDRNSDGAIQQSEARQGPPDMERQGRGDR
jgi:Ca2+-binding EF-hand superfamily protein